MKTKVKAPLKALFAVPNGVWCILFIIAPMAFVAYYAFTDSAGAFTMANIGKVFSSSYLFIMERSVLLAVEATLLCLIIAYPLAYAISRMKERNQALVIMMLMLPMWINLLIRTYSLKLILPPALLQTEFAIIIGMVYNYLPYMILPIYTTLSKIDPRVLEAAQDLGCNTVQTMLRVILPLSVSGIVSGITMVFVPSISTFFISQCLSDGRIKLIGDVIETQISAHTVASYNIGSALSFVLMVLILISMFIANRFGDEDGGVVI